MAEVGGLQDKAAIEGLLFKRIRESGNAAIDTARILPSVLSNPNLSPDDVDSIAEAIYQCRTNSAALAREAELSGSARLLQTAQKVESLWVQLVSTAMVRSRQLERAA